MRERMRRAAALLCAVVMALALWPVGAWAEDTHVESFYYVTTYTNPVYPELVHDTNTAFSFYDSSDYALFSDNEQSTNDAVQSCATVQEAGTYIRQQFKVRDVSISFLYTGVPQNGPLAALTADEMEAPYTEEELEAADNAVAAGAISESQKDDYLFVQRQFSKYINLLLEAILGETFRHDRNDPVGGDYMAYHYSNFLLACAYDSDNNALLFTFEFSYMSHADQEDAVSDAANVILATLDLSEKNDYGKVKAIYGWLCDNVSYDNEHLNDKTYLLKHSAYAALVDKTAVCQGYATAFYRLALMAGLDARVVTGYGDGGPHGWNIVRLDGQWYYVDATWDAGVKEKDWRFFLRASLDQHELDELGESVVAQYHISPVDYYRDVGQLNTDGSITVQDMQLLYTFLTTGDVPVGQNVLADGVFQQAADVNRDGQVDVYDLQMLYEIVCQIA